MKHFHKGYSLLTIVLVTVVFSVSLLVYPEWRTSPLRILGLAVIVVIGGVAFVAELRTATEVKEKGPEKGQMSHRTAEEVRPRQLPAPPNDFTGRTNYFDKLLAAVRNGARAVGIFGMGGIGKTALALKLGERISNNYPSGQIYLDVKGYSQKPLSSIEIIAYVIHSLDSEINIPSDGRELFSFYRSKLANLRLLLFLDNVSGSELIEDIMPPKNNLVIFTSREHFKLSNVISIELPLFSAEESRDFLLKISHRVSNYTQEFSSACGFLPLALRFSATFLEEHQDIEIQEYLQLLNDSKRRLDPVDACLDVSYRYLDEEKQMFWRVLSVFPGTFDVLAVADVWEIDEVAAKFLLSGFVRYSLLEWNPETLHYKMHDLARSFASNHLLWSEHYQFGLLYAIYYGKLLHKAENLFLKGGNFSIEGLKLLDSEIHNVNAAQAWSAQCSTFIQGAAFLCSKFPSLGPYILLLRQNPKEIKKWHEDGLAASRITGDRQAEAANLDGLGISYAKLNDFKQAILHHRQAISIARDVNNRQGEGDSLDNLGSAYCSLGRPYRASIFHKAALAIARELDDRFREGRRLTNLAIDNISLGNYQECIDLLKQSHKIKEEVGDLGGLTGIHIVFTQAFFSTRKYFQAVYHYVKAFRLAKQHNDIRMSEIEMLSKENIFYRFLFGALSFLTKISNS